MHVLTSPILSLTQGDEFDSFSVQFTPKSMYKNGESNDFSYLLFCL